MAAITRRTLILAAAAAGLTGCDRKPADAAEFKAIDITGATYADALSLTDTDGKPRTLADFKGKVAVVFFGYTQCPDVCPTTLVELAEVRKALGAQGDRVQGVFVTVDPERDTPQVLKAYVDNFGAGFVALRGSDEQTKAAAKAFKVFYAKVPGRDGASYSVDHTAGSYVIDAQGKPRLFVRYGSGAAALQHDLQLLLAQG